MFEQKLRELRISQNKTKSQVASYLNISVQSYSRIESGQKSPDLDMLTSLSALFGVSLSELLDDSTQSCKLVLPSPLDHYDLAVRKLSGAEKNLFVPYFEMDYSLRQSMIVHLQNAFYSHYGSVYEAYSVNFIDYEVACYRKELDAKRMGEIS